MEFNLSNSGRLADLWRYTHNDGANYSRLYGKWRFDPVKLPTSPAALIIGTILGVVLLPITWISFPFYTQNIIARVLKSYGCWTVIIVFCWLSAILFTKHLYLPPKDIVLYLPIILVVFGTAVVFGMLTELLQDSYNSKHIEGKITINWVDQEEIDAQKELERQYFEYEEHIKRLTGLTDPYRIKYEQRRRFY